MEENFLKCAKTLDDLKKNNDMNKKLHFEKKKEDTIIQIPQDIDFIKKNEGNDKDKKSNENKNKDENSNSIVILKSSLNKDEL